VVWQKRTVCSSMSRMMRLLLSIGELLPISFGISWDLEFVFALAKNLFWWIDLCVCVFAVYCILTLSSFLERKKTRSKAFSRSLFSSCS
jgi:amino acid permease